MNNPIPQIRQLLNRSQNVASDQIERIVTELEYARQLMDWHPTKAKSWAPLVEEAGKLVQKACATGETSEIKSAVQAAEKILAPLAATAKSYQIYLAGHAHIDMNWMWSWPETVAIVNDSFATVLQLLEEFPEFHFTQSQTAIYAIVEKYHPQMFPRIARYVKEGRWEVAASHWVENDKNMSGPESLARHLLYSREYMQKHFGLSAEDVPIDWSPDTFGHAITVPTYLIHGGVRYVYLHRPGNETSSKPRAFWWKARDGAKVLVHNDMLVGYTGALHPERLLNSLRMTVNEIKLPMTMYVFGVGDHGGGPTRRDLLFGREMATWPIFPKLIFSKAKTYFEELEKIAGKLVVLEEELNFEFTGCYSSQSLIKKANRLGENRLVDLEVASALSWAALHRSVPTDMLQEEWRKVLFNQFHDILPGAGVHDTRTYAHGLFQQVMASTSISETETLRHLASHVDTTCYASPKEDSLPASRFSSGMGAGAGVDGIDGSISSAERSGGHGNRPFLIFNPTAQERHEVIELKIWDNAAPGELLPFNRRPFSLQSPDGTKIPAQVIDPNGNAWGHQFVTLAVPVTVPALGYTTFAITEEASEAKTPSFIRNVGRSHHHGPLCKNEREPEGLENEFLRVEFDMMTGGIRSLIDKRTGVELIKPSEPSPAFEYAHEIGHFMTAWAIDHNRPVEYPKLRGYWRKYFGSYKVVFESWYRIHDSEFNLFYELRAGDPRLYIRLKGTWVERGTNQEGIPSLRFAFPLALDQAKITCEIPFGALERPYNRGQELPALQWAGVAGKSGNKKAGLLLINDAKHGYSLDGNTLRLTLIRSTCDPDPLPEIGSHDIQVALEPFSGDLPITKAIDSGRAFNHPLKVIGTSVHQAALPPESSFISLNSTVSLSSVKKAQNEEALVLTFFEPTGKPQTLTAEFNAKLVGKIKSAKEVDLLERPLKKSGIRIQGQKIHLKIPAYGIASVLVHFSESR